MSSARTRFLLKGTIPLEEMIVKKLKLEPPKRGANPKSGERGVKKMGPEVTGPF